MTTKKKEQAKVVSQEQLADGIFSMWIKTEAAGSARPGQFISMYTNDGSKLLPRPISICEIDKEGGKLRVVYRVTGEKTGTEEFSQMKAGDTIPVIGPLGNGFPFEKAEGKKVFLMGGGIGVPPILELAKQMEYFDLLQSSNMMQQISEQENLQDFAGVLSGFTYLIRGLKELYVCICDDWDGINNTGRRGYSVNGYSENIIMFHLTGDSGGYSIMPLDKAFSDICGGKNPGDWRFQFLGGTDGGYCYVQ